MSARPQAPHYRIIFNWDGDSLAYGEYPQTARQLVDFMYQPLEGTQVDAMFWNIGSHEALWPSETLEREAAVPKEWEAALDRQEDFIEELLGG